MYGRRQFIVSSCRFIIYNIQLFVNCLLPQKEIMNYDSQYDWEHKYEINIFFRDELLKCNFTTNYYVKWTI